MAADAEGRAVKKKENQEELHGVSELENGKEHLLIRLWVPDPFHYFLM